MHGARPDDWKASSFSWLDMDEASKGLGSEDARGAGSYAGWARPGTGKSGRRCCSFFHISNCLERLVYLLERHSSQHGWLVQCTLLVLTGSITLIIGGLSYGLVWEYDPSDIRDEEDVNRFLEGVWEAWTFMADGGSHAGKVLPWQRIVAAAISVFGIIYMGIVLAVIVDLVRSRIDAMKRGRTMVFESGHTLVVNWTDKTIPVIQELCNANKSEGGGVVVVLSKESRDLMELELSLQLPRAQRFGTRIICRNGSPLAVHDLYIVSSHKAKAVVILADGNGADEADSSTLRCVLSLKSMNRPLSGHIVAELRDIDNEPLLKLVGGKVVESLVSHDVLGRLMIMAVRQPGLAKVYEAVLGFEGHEFYMREWPELVGVRFADLQFRFPNAVPLGVCRSDGMLVLNPDSGREVEPGDKIIVIAEDDDTYRPEPQQHVEVGTPPQLEISPPRVERALVCGWRRDIRDILLLLDSVMKEGSEVHIMSHCVPIESRDMQLLEEGLDVRSMSNITLVHYGGNTSVRKRLEVLPIETYTSCMIFADQSYEEDTMHADSHSLATLLLIRDIESLRCRKRPAPNPSAMTTSHPTPIICEILDSRTQRTIVGHKTLSLSSDFVQSNKLVAQILAMVAESRSVKIILDELLGIGGASLLVVPPHWYAGKLEEVSFFTLAKRAMLHNAILIGYQLRGSTDGTVLNPDDKDQLMIWDDFDLAVIAGDHSFANVNSTYTVQQARGMIRRDQSATSSRGGFPGTRSEASMSASMQSQGLVGGSTLSQRLRTPETSFAETTNANSILDEGFLFGTQEASCGESSTGVRSAKGRSNTNGSLTEEADEVTVPAESVMPMPVITPSNALRRVCGNLSLAERRKLGEAFMTVGSSLADGTLGIESRKGLRHGSPSAVRPHHFVAT